MLLTLQTKLFHFTATDVHCNQTTADIYFIANHNSTLSGVYWTSWKSWTSWNSWGLYRLYNAVQYMYIRTTGDDIQATYTMWLWMSWVSWLSRYLFFGTYCKSMTGEDIACELITALSTKFGILSDLLLHLVWGIVPLSTMLQSVFSQWCTRLWLMSLAFLIH